MPKKYRDIAEDMALSALENLSANSPSNLSHAGWIRLLRQYLRMTQKELALRVQIPQSHLAAIETGKIDPQIGTVKKIFQGLSCDLIMMPRPQKPLTELLRGRARSLALKRLKQAMGTMALENQAPEKESFARLLEKRTDDILHDPRARLWSESDE